MFGSFLSLLERELRRCELVPYRSQVRVRQKRTLCPVPDAIPSTISRVLLLHHYNNGNVLNYNEFLLLGFCVPNKKPRFLGRRTSLYLLAFVEEHGASHIHDRYSEIIQQRRILGLIQ